MAVTSQQILDFLTSNPGMSDAQIVAAMEQYGVSPAQMASAVGIPEGEVISRVAATVPEGSSITLGDTNIAPQYQVIGSGEDRQVLGIENIYTMKTDGDINYKAPVGSEYQVLNPDGTFQSTGTVKKDQSFFGGLVDAFKDPVVLAALGGAAYGGLLGGGGAATAGVTGANGAFLGEGALSGIAASDAALAGATVGSTGLTMSQLAQLDMALGGAGGTTGATQLANALMTGASIPTITALTGGSGAGLLSNISNTLGGLTSTLGGGTTGALTTGATTAATTGATTGATTEALTGGLTNALTNTGVSTAVNSLLNNKNLGNLITGGLTTSAGLLQSQTSKEAAQRAQAMIDAETAAAKQAAMFRPVGMTTRFGTSNFQVDPVTGQITSAGYTLSPEAKAAQDRLVNLAGQGLTQAEQAQAQFAPIQTGAQNLFNLGNQYIAQSPEQVAQNYMNQQLALLQPGRELELANLQNKLQQQGRGGLSVAQGGTLGATTPELQALFNARAQQEALLAANAQQAGQQQVTFGAGLLGQGANAMGQYYGGQQAAYAPYTTALGQVQALEAAGQQPFTMGAQLGQTAATAGANVGRLGLAGAELSAGLATGQAATNNPYAQLMAGLGGSNTFGTAAGNILGGLFSNTPAMTALSAPATSFGAGSYYGNQDLGLFL